STRHVLSFTVFASSTELAQLLRRAHDPCQLGGGPLIVRSTRCFYETLVSMGYAMQSACGCQVRVPSYLRGEVRYASAAIDHCHCHLRAYQGFKRRDHPFRACGVQARGGVSHYQRLPAHGAGLRLRYRGDGSVNLPLRARLSEADHCTANLSATPVRTWLDCLQHQLWHPGAARLTRPPGRGAQLYPDTRRMGARHLAGCLW